MQLLQWMKERFPFIDSTGVMASFNKEHQVLIPLTHCKQNYTAGFAFIRQCLNCCPWPLWPFVFSPWLHDEQAHHMVEHETFSQICPSEFLGYSWLLVVEAAFQRLTTTECFFVALPLRLHLPSPLRLLLHLHLALAQ